VVWADLLAADLASHLADFAPLIPRKLLNVPVGDQERWRQLCTELELYRELASYPQRCRLAATKLAKWDDEAPDLAAVADALLAGAATVDRLVSDLDAIADTAERLVLQMDFGFLYDRRRGLFSIGYRPAASALDTSCYDLLASEARLASLVAIAKGEVPVRHWFRLGRPLTGKAHSPALCSWSGSMFEYLMPALVMHSPAGSLLDTSCARAVRRHREYGREMGLPWGVSESAFNVRDQAFTYQYADFGVPGLGLKRGLGRNHVISPYATALATIYGANDAVRNFAALQSFGARGSYGFYDALDFTPAGSKHITQGQVALPEGGGLQ
jgi:cyclic beta-1,2-glucan synthetase